MVEKAAEEIVEIFKIGMDARSEKTEPSTGRSGGGTWWKNEASLRVGTWRRRESRQGGRVYLNAPRGGGEVEKIGSSSPGEKRIKSARHSTLTLPGDERGWGGFLLKTSRKRSEKGGQPNPMGDNLALVTMREKIGKEKIEGKLSKKKKLRRISGK